MQGDSSRIKKEEIYEKLKKYSQNFPEEVQQKINSQVFKEKIDEFVRYSKKKSIDDVMFAVLYLKEFSSVPVNMKKNNKQISQIIKKMEKKNMLFQGCNFIISEEEKKKKIFKDMKEMMFDICGNYQLTTAQKEFLIQTQEKLFH